MWNCTQHHEALLERCDYDICKDCVAKKEIKCNQNHLLSFDVKSTRGMCKFCDDSHYACMKCPGNNCDFAICLECCLSESKLKDERGHPCKRDPEREKLKIVCDYCGKYSPGMVSCKQCMYDVCRKCSGDKSIAQLNVVGKQTELKSTWIGHVSKYKDTYVNGNYVDEGKYVYIRVEMDAEGFVMGTAEYQWLDKRPNQNFNVTGYHYLNHIAISCFSAEKNAQSFYLYGSGDSEMHEIICRLYPYGYKESDVDIADKVTINYQY